MVFDAYARYYDLLYRDKDYSVEAEYVAKSLRQYAPRATRILELGCGTGAHAEFLARMGYSVHGIDLSETMLARAEARKARMPSEIAARMSFSAGDVGSVRRGKTCDAVISLFHVISYQSTDAALDSFFKTAAAHLHPGGLLLYDFWYGPAVLMQRPEVRVKRLEDREIKVTRIAEPAMHVNDNVVDVNYTVFIEVNATGKIEQVRETHRMRYLFLPELRRYQQGEFDELGTYEWMSSAPPSEQAWAGFQVLARV